jgi:cardiolipin synthase
MRSIDFGRRQARPQRGWVPGNKVELLENGEQFFPAVFSAIENAQREVLVETFILFEDKVGLKLKDVLIAAARRGVSVDVLVDDWGSPDLSDAYIGALTQAGVRVRAFDPKPRWFGFRLHAFRRMHRKIVVVDGRVAFVGGINFSADHLLDFGPEAKLDHSVRLEGPIAERIRRFARSQLPGRLPTPVLGDLTAPAPGGTAEVMFVTRDNRDHRDDIERQYRAAIRSARREVIIANAYFFPGYRLLKTIRQAAQRGVRVCLILQGQPDMPIVKAAAELLHHPLLHAKVEIHEYCRRPLHGKVALVDDDWATVGSSNLDPLSLSLNLEANVMIRDRAFNAVLRERMVALMQDDCRRVARETVEHRSRWRMLLGTLAYHLTRQFPAWAGWLPAHMPRLAQLAPQRTDEHEPLRRTG